MNTDNALVHQKDRIIAIINDATCVEQLEKAAALVEFSAELWTALGYDYKARELNKRIATLAAKLTAEEEDYLAGCRKNDRTRRSTEATIVRLQQLTALGM